MFCPPSEQLTPNLLNYFFGEILRRTIVVFLRPTLRRRELEKGRLLEESYRDASTGIETVKKS